MTCEHCASAATSRGPTIVKDQADALALLGRARSGRKVIHGSLRIESSALSPSEREQWREQISALANDCGCGVGSAVGLLATGAYVVSVLAFDLGETRSGWKLAGIGALVLFAAALVGKLVGLLLSRRRLRDLVRRLVVTLGPARRPSPTLLPERESPEDAENGMNWASLRASLPSTTGQPDCPGATYVSAPS